MSKSLGTKHYDNLQLLRVIAVLGVFLAHLAQKLEIQGHIRSITDLGSLCVELFIMLGGFFAVRHFDTSAPPRRTLRYYLKRMLRLLPLYYLIVVYFFITETFIFCDVPEDPSGIGWLRYVFLLAGNIRSGDSFFDFWTNIGATWTVFVFATFYFLMPVIYRIARNYWSAVAFLCCSWILRLYLEYSDCPYLHTLTYLVFFAAGILLWYSEKEAKNSITYTLLGGALIFNIAIKGTILEFNELILATIAYVMIAMATFSIQITNQAVKRFVKIIDEYSYTIYLGQGIVFCGIIDKFAMAWSKAMIFIVSVFATIAICYTIYNFYEKPIYKLGNRMIELLIQSYEKKQVKSK